MPGPLVNKLALATSLASSVVSTLAYSNGANDNIAMYWGQNSYGATSSNTALWQQDLATYCQDTVIDAIPLAFLTVFESTGGLPEINFANTCNEVDSGVFPGTSLANCQFMASDIETCQAAGKIVTLSMGGATGAAVFTSDAQGTAFAQTIWDLFLGGSSSTRPFGSAVLDGVDLDIEGGGSTGYAAFVTELRALAAGASKQYYVTGAPQCPFPDAYLGSVINAVGFDALYVQFYNNYCELTNFANSADWDFSSWDTWAKTVSPNKNIKIYIGAPASSTAAGSGYVDASTLASIALTTRSQYSSFGGVMFWDASQAWANSRPDAIVKAALINGASTSSPTSTTSKVSTTTKISTTSSSSTITSSSSATTTVGTGSCSSVAAWSSGIAYNGGSQVTYNGHLWTNLYWSFNDTPGGSAGVWVDEGACTTNGPLAAATEPATLTDSRHVVDKAHTVNVITGTAQTKAVQATAAPKQREIRYAGGFF